MLKSEDYMCLCLHTDLKFNVCKSQWTLSHVRRTWQLSLWKGQLISATTVNALLRINNIQLYYALREVIFLQYTLYFKKHYASWGKRMLLPLKMCYFENRNQVLKMQRFQKVHQATNLLFEMFFFHAKYYKNLVEMICSQSWIF